jgi:hypothetical protein
MVTKEIKQFVISQMKEADWSMEKYRDSTKYNSKHLNIFDGVQVELTIIIPHGYSQNDHLKLTRKELGINYFHFRWLLRIVKKSCKLVDKRRRYQEISRNWNKFLERNKDLKRDNRINQVLD